jgi:heme/copper-type cytochrome/quinol oxidase subunit 2
MGLVQEKNDMFKIVMIIALAILAMAWVAYGVWRYRENLREKRGEKPTTEHLEKIKNSFEEYAKKLKNYERKPYKRE